jgi:hypothetical protein
MKVEDLIMQISLENGDVCSDTFHFFMTEVIERLYVINSRVKAEVIINQFDSTKIVGDLFAHRNYVLNDIKIRELSPYYALTEYASYAKLSVDEYLSALTYVAYLCSRLSLRHHSRGRSASAAVYANEVILCTDVMCTYLGTEIEAGKARSVLAKYAADKRHVNTHARRQEVVEYFLEIIYPTNPEITNDKAGEWLKDSFPDLSHRKLAEYVSEAKKNFKKIPLASKA